MTHLFLYLSKQLSRIEMNLDTLWMKLRST